MRGFPKYINTTADLENVAKFYPKESADYQEKLAGNRFIWQDAGPVGTKEVVKETAALKAVETEIGAGVIEWRKMARVEDPTAQFFKLGLKVADV